MFFTRINKIKVFNNREGFLGLFDRAEMRIYSRVSAGNDALLNVTLADLVHLKGDDKALADKLLELVMNGTDELTQSNYLEKNGVRGNESIYFGDAGFLVYQSGQIPERLDFRLWVIESDSDVRKVALTAGEVAGSNAFKGLVGAVGAALAITNPLLTSAIALGGLAAKILHDRISNDPDDLVGFWQTSLNRKEHYPNGLRDKQDVRDLTGNILVDYTLFGYENAFPTGN
jgi:hypothetical protein